MNSNVNISEEVILTIANIATKEVKGVSGVHNGVVDAILDKIKPNNWRGGVSAIISEEEVEISVIINVFYGEKIHEVAKSVQENIKNSIETMTDKKVSEVNVHIHGVTVASATSEK